MSTDSSTKQLKDHAQSSNDAPFIPHPYGGKAISAVIDELGGAPVSNFDGDTMAKWRLRALATGTQCKGFAEMPKTGIDLKYFFAHRIEMVSSRGGEVIYPIRVVLIDRDLNAYGFVSEGIPKDIDGIIQDFGWGPWCLPAKVCVTEGKTRGNQKFYSLGPAI